MDYTNALIIVPSYREEKNIRNVIQGLKRHAFEYDVLIIDDGSKDQTQELATIYNMKALKHPFNMGYGVTIQTGYKYAVKNGYDVVVQCDGDGQHDPRFIKPLVNALKGSGVDVVIGSRFIEGAAMTPPFSEGLGSCFFPGLPVMLRIRTV